MFYQVSKLLQSLASPLGLSLALMIAAIVLSKRKAARTLGIAAVVLLLVFSSPIVAGALLRSLEDQYPDRPIESIPKAQAIVLLGGSLHWPARRHSRSALLDPSDRILHAFRLYRAGKAPLIMISGGNGNGGPAESKFMAQLLEEWGLPAEAILMEGGSRTTRENAVYSHDLLQTKGISQILLVTSATHMPRAAALFRKVGFTVIPAPADYATGWNESTLLDSLIPSAHAMEATGRALREWIGFGVYRLRGWC